MESLFLIKYELIIFYLPTNQNQSFGAFLLPPTSFSMNTMVPNLSPPFFNRASQWAIYRPTMMDFECIWGVLPYKMLTKPKSIIS